MPRHPAVKREEIVAGTKRRLLDAATEELATKGFAGANINRISTAAGFAKGTIYNYFSSKRALMLALIDEIAAHQHGFIWSRVASESDPERRIQSCFDAGFAYAERFPRRAQVALSALYGPDRQLKKIVLDSTMDLFSLVAGDIVGSDIVAGGVVRRKALSGNGHRLAALLLSLYLGSCPFLDREEGPWLEPGELASFILEGVGRPVEGSQQRQTMKAGRPQESWRQW